MAYTNAKVRENYSRRFRVRFPNEELPAGAPAAHHADLRLRSVGTAPCSGRPTGSSTRCGIAADGEERSEHWSFRRTNAFAAVARECRAVREGVGLMEISTYAKYEVTGPKAEEFLDRMLAEPPAEGGPHRARADARRERPASRRFHGRAARRTSASSSSAPASPRPITCAGSSVSCRTARRDPGLRH